MITLRNALRIPFDFVLNKVRSSRNVSPSQKTSKGANVFASILSPIETYVVSLQSLLIWERPYVSAAAFVTINCLYWLLVSWNRRFFSILSIASLAIYIYRTWKYHIWPEIRVPPKEEEDTEEWTTVNPQVFSVPEISNYLNDFFNKMFILWSDVWRLRRENHGLFCALTCAFLSLLALFGHLVPGVLIIYAFVLLLSLGPGITLHLIPATLYDQMVGYFAESDVANKAESNASGGNSDEDSYLDEFLPGTSTEIIRQLSLREDSLEMTFSGSTLADLPEDAESDVRELGVESYSNEMDDLLYQGLGSFPSVEEECESDISDDILPKPETTGLYFVSSHFKEDSSGSESDVFTRDLSFSGAQEAQKPKEIVSGAEKPESEDLPALKVSLSTDDELTDFEILEGSEVNC